ncbi:MAG: crossover junction endodeoxyribonuclease RuvC [Candidatus Acidiferrum sp.]
MAVFLCTVDRMTIEWNARALRLRLAGMGEKPSNKNSPGSLRVLGVDPAAAGPTGYAVIVREGLGCRVLHYGALKVPAKRQQSSAGAALHDVHALLCELIAKYKPHVMAVESVFTALNMRTALRLAEVRGVVLLAAEQLGVEVRSYSPREVKSCVAGYGNADKKQMQIMVRALLGMNEIPEPSHAADALAVALCHLQTEQLERRFGVRKAELTRGARPGSQKQSAINGHATIERGIRIQPVR